MNRRAAVGVREHELECGVAGKVNEHESRLSTSEYAATG